MDDIKKWKTIVENALNEAIAPHGDFNNEFKMMMSGAKPAALVYDEHFDQLYAPVIDKMKWEIVKFDVPGADATIYVVGQSGQKARVQRIAQLVTGANSMKIPMDAAYHTELGKLLGYSDQDIQDFLERITKNKR